MLYKCGKCGKSIVSFFDPIEYGEIIVKCSCGAYNKIYNHYPKIYHAEAVEVNE